MADRIIRRSWEVEGVLTNVTSAKLSDPTGTYGVKRNDTDAVVVADGTDMTNSATGIYEYSFTDVVGVSYTAFVEIVYDGATYYFEEDFSARAAGDTIAGVTYTSLSVAIADYLGWGRNTEGTGSDWSSNDLSRISDIINSGYLQFMNPPILPGETTAHRWTFLRPQGTFDTVASDYEYDMPSDFAAIVGDMYYDIDSDIKRVLDHVSPGYIDRLRTGNSYEGRPTKYALRPKDVSQTTRQTWEVILYPTPDNAYTLLYYYDTKIEELSTANLYPLGGQWHSETILQSCRDIAAQRYKDDPSGREHELFMQRLQASVEADRRNSPEYLGYNGDPSEGFSVTRHPGYNSVSMRHNLGGGP